MSKKTTYKVYSHEYEDGTVYVKMIDTGEEQCILIDEMFDDWDTVQKMIDEI